MTDTGQIKARMPENPIDRRVRRTEAALWQALLALMQDHDWGNISVQMICDRADVARSTFYTHYPAKHDLLDAGFASGASEIEDLIRAMAADPARLPTVVWLVGHVADSSGFVRRVQGTQPGQAILSRFRATVTAYLRRDLGRMGLSPADSDLAFAVGGTFGAIEHWVSRNCAEGTDAMVRRLSAGIMAAVRVTSDQAPADRQPRSSSICVAPSPGVTPATR
jgi:AcrR family transcriptional regulator